MEKMNEEALRRIRGGGDVKEETKARRQPISYKSPGQLPRENEVKQLKIYVGELLSLKARLDGGHTWIWVDI
jgi:hypothetical protein